MPAAPPDCATTAFVEKSQEPRRHNAIEPDNYKNSKKDHLQIKYKNC